MKETDYSPHIRLRLIHEVRKSSASDVSRRWGMSRRIVGKWVKRYEDAGYEGLKDLSRAPKSPHGALSAKDRKQIVKLRKAHPTVGAARLKRMLRLSYSVKSLSKVWKEEGLIPPRKRKHVTKVNMRQVKKEYRLGQQIQMDTKDLYDIPEMYSSLMAHNLPLVQYTAREVTSGIQWLAYARERSLLNSSVFASRILNALADSGVENISIQTDNGSEFIGNVAAKNDSLFTKLVEDMGASHTTIPPGYKTYQADVETAHNLIEDELYRIEKFKSLPYFLRKANAYQCWFNILRDNSYKEYQTPWQIASQKVPGIKASLVMLPAILLDEHLITKRFMQAPATRRTSLFDILVRPQLPDHHVGYLPTLEWSKVDGQWIVLAKLLPLSNGRGETDMAVGLNAKTGEVIWKRSRALGATVNIKVSKELLQANRGVEEQFSCVSDSDYSSYKIGDTSYLWNTYTYADPGILAAANYCSTPSTDYDALNVMYWVNSMNKYWSATFSKAQYIPAATNKTAAKIKTMATAVQLPAWTIAGFSDCDGCYGVLAHMNSIEYSYRGIWDFVITQPALNRAVIYHETTHGLLDSIGVLGENSATYAWVHEGVANAMECLYGEYGCDFTYEVDADGDMKRDFFVRLPSRFGDSTIAKQWDYGSFQSAAARGALLTNAFIEARNAGVRFYESKATMLEFAWKAVVAGVSGTKGKSTLGAIGNSLLNLVESSAASFAFNKNAIVNEIVFFFQHYGMGLGSEAGKAPTSAKVLGFHLEPSFDTVLKTDEILTVYSVLGQLNTAQLLFYDSDPGTNVNASTCGKFNLGVLGQLQTDPEIAGFHRATNSRQVGSMFEDCLKGKPKGSYVIWIGMRAAAYWGAPTWEYSVKFPYAMKGLPWVIVNWDPVKVECTGCCGSQIAPASFNQSSLLLPVLLFGFWRIRRGWHA